MEPWPQIFSESSMMMTYLAFLYLQTKKSLLSLDLVLLWSLWERTQVQDRTERQMNSAAGWVWWERLMMSWKSKRIVMKYVKGQKARQQFMMMASWGYQNRWKVTNSQFHNWAHSSSSATGVFCCVFSGTAGRGSIWVQGTRGVRICVGESPNADIPKKERMKGWACWRHRDRGEVWVIGWHGKVTPKFKWKGENVLGAGREGRWFHRVWRGMMRFGGGARVIIKWWERRWSSIPGLPQTPNHVTLLPTPSTLIPSTSDIAVALGAWMALWHLAALCCCFGVMERNWGGGC